MPIKDFKKRTFTDRTVTLYAFNIASDQTLYCYQRALIVHKFLKKKTEKSREFANEALVKFFDYMQRTIIRNF